MKNSDYSSQNEIGGWGVALLLKMHGMMDDGGGPRHASTVTGLTPFQLSGLAAAGGGSWCP